MKNLDANKPGNFIIEHRCIVTGHIHTYKERFPRLTPLTVREALRNIPDNDVIVRLDYVTGSASDGRA